jgi:hypothetical protein
VLKRDRRLAGQQLRQEAREQPGVGVVAPAGRLSDQKPDGLALVERLVGAGRRQTKMQHGEQQDRAKRGHRLLSAHRSSLPFDHRGLIASSMHVLYQD